MLSSGLSLKLAAFGAVAFTLVGVVAGVTIRPVFDGGEQSPSASSVTKGSPGPGNAQARAGGPRQGGAPQGGPPRSGGMAPAITTAAVEASTVEKRIDAIGASRSAKSVTLIAEATGLVKEVKFKAGQKVAAGDLLMQIDDSQQRFELTRLKAQYPIAKANAERYADLLENNAASRLETEAAFNAYKAVEADLKAAEFAVSQRAIRAPFAGVVGLTTIEAGDYIRAGDVATTIDDLSALVIEFTVPQESAADVKLGQQVRAALASSQGESVAGAITAVDSRVDAVSRTLRVEASFANEGGALIPGATYAVTTTNEGAPALSMPGLAVQWDRTGAYVWKLDETGAAIRVGIRILQRRDQLAIAEGDLKPGDFVVVEGADRVRPGMQFPDAVSGIALSDQSAAG